MEKLFPGNVEKKDAEGNIIKKKTGREDENTLSNLAHVEAVLGRENEEGQISAGIVDYWAEYVRKQERPTCSR